MNEAKILAESLFKYFSDEHAELDKKQLELDKMQFELDQKQLDLHKNESEFHQICFKLNLDLIKSQAFHESSILTHRNQRDLIKLCQFNQDTKWKLIYRGSEHGFSAKRFHEKCDSFSNTLTLIKTIDGYIFGGYASEAWHSNNGYVNDPQAFIFSLINSKNSPILIKCSYNEYAFSCNSNNGPTFGGGCDIFISDNSNVNTLSYSNLGYSYKHPDFVLDSIEAQTFLANSKHFQTSEIEVFHKI
jgi:hypothetical protein